MMQFRCATLVLVAAILVSACDLWPQDLESLAESIGRNVSGDTTAWLVGGDIVVIDVAGSPLYHSGPVELERHATEIAGQAIAFIPEPLESIAVSFHEGAVSEDPEKMHEFIFLVTEGRPVLQPYIERDVTGPLTDDEIQAAVDRLDESYEYIGKPLAAEYRACVVAELKKRADEAGGPETLDPERVEFLTVDTWYALDAFGKRLILMQAIMTKALFTCVSAEKAGVNS